MNYCDYDVPAFFSESYPRAKRDYPCCECSALIRKGEYHGKYVGKWDQEVSTFRQHILCRDACVWIKEQFQGGECICFGDLHEWWNESGYARPGTWNEDRKQYRQEKKDPKVITLRHMIAEIKWRERKKCSVTLPHSPTNS